MIGEDRQITGSFITSAMMSHVNILCLGIRHTESSSKSLNESRVMAIQLRHISPQSRFGGNISVCGTILAGPVLEIDNQSNRSGWYVPDLAIGDPGILMIKEHHGSAKIF